VSVSPSRKVYCWRLSDAVEKSFGNVALPRIDRLLPTFRFGTPTIGRRFHEHSRDVA